MDLFFRKIYYSGQENGEIFLRERERQREREREREVRVCKGEKGERNDGNSSVKMKRIKNAMRSRGRMKCR